MGVRQVDHDGDQYTLLKEVEAPKASPLALSANLITATLGCGILSLPWATAGASMLPAAALTVVVLALNAGTMLILVLAAERHQVFDLGGLLGKLPGFGPAAKATCEVAIWLTVFLCLVGYLIVVADSFEVLLPGTPRVLIVALGSAVVLPLCFLDQRRLAFTSSLSIAANLYVCFLLASNFISGWRKPADVASEEHYCILGFGRGSMTMVSVLMQAAVVQMCILPMYEELDQRSPRRFAACLGVSFAFVALLFVAFSSVAYVTFGPGVSSNILIDLPPGPFSSVARMVMALAVIGVYPILLASMVAPVRHCEEAAEAAAGDETQKARRLGFWTYLSSPSWIATVAIVACSAATAVLATDLGKVNVISGASQVAVFVALAPGLVGLYLLEMKGIIWRAAMACLIATGILVSGLGLVFRENHAQELQANCRWLAERAL